MQNYLLGNNPNLYGSIIGFKRGWRKNKPEFVDYYSFLLYFSHETGRIERYLYNSGCKINSIFFNNVSEKESQEYYNFKVAIDQKIKSQKLLTKFISLENINIINLNLHKISFDNLYDGKLNSKMFNMFIFELLRDYFLFKQSYIICDMKFLRKHTEGKNIDNKYLKLGTGKFINKRELIQDFSLHFTGCQEDFEKSIKCLIFGLTEFYATRFINYNDNNNLLINIPKNFNNSLFNSILNKLDYDIVTLDKSNEPQCIKDLKTYINSRNVLNYKDLSSKIMKWNNIIDKKLNKLDN